MFFRFAIAGLAFSLFATSGFAANSVEESIKNKLKASIPEVIIHDVQKSPIADFYQVQIDSGKIFYVSEDGKYLIQGYLFDLTTGTTEPRNITLEAEEKHVAALINGLDQSKMIIYPAKDNKARAHITVFTDSSCPVCHVLHKDVATLNARGIEVRYMAFPRNGLASDGFEQLQSVWCATDKKAAMDQFMQESSGKVASKKCNSPIFEQFILGQKIGIRATPTIVLSDGKIVPGYYPANQLTALALAATKKIASN